MQDIKHIFFLIIFIFVYQTGYLLNAQEILIPLNENPKLKEYLKVKSSFKNHKATDTLELPFYDDFSSSNLYPNPKLWADSFAFVNSSYPDLPPSIGVATLDAIDEKGEFYSGAGYDISFIADYLSTQPINLNYPGNQTIYLSFYYQPQGLGDNPEEKDSLFLEFYEPEAQKWNTVWKKEGGLNQNFEQVILHINESNYLKKGFRFRFKNLASLSTNSFPSKVGNVDHWHIDYIVLDTGRSASDLVPHDIAFVNPMHSFLNDYQAMPWKHFLVNPASELKPNIEVTYRNNDNIDRLIERLDFVFIDNTSNRANDTLHGGSSDLTPNLLVDYSAPYSYSFVTNSTDTASFLIKSLITTDDFDPIENNELHYIQKFYNYYAYDDGSAEVGYGLIGEGSRFARLAYQFNSRKSDTLQAVQMYFNRTLNDASQKYFYLTVWDDDGTGLPGQIIYEKEGALPKYENELNKFHTFNIDTLLVVSGVFYVGWVQTTEDMLNIGFDKNTSIDNKIFYNITGEWVNSKFVGSLMIRPVFGENLITSVPKLTEQIYKKPQIHLYPNPVKNTLQIQLENYTINNSINLSIINMRGQIIYHSEFENEDIVDFSDFNEGIYFLRFTDKNKSFIETKKIIKIN
ncbi:MAG: hypothetical protein DRI95_03065 [Bacteroidetes bacterium]|nr:MAG: hypothetical protein DRI95_03065 [Bacteroidota bacterium]